MAPKIIMVKRREIKDGGQEMALIVGYTKLKRQFRCQTTVKCGEDNSNSPELLVKIFAINLHSQLFLGHHL